MPGASAVNAQSNARKASAKMEKTFNKARTGKRVTDYRENPYLMGKIEGRSLRSRAIGAYRQGVVEHGLKLGEIENTLRFVQEKLESMSMVLTSITDGVDDVQAQEAQNQLHALREQITKQVQSVKVGGGTLATGLANIQCWLDADRSVTFTISGASVTELGISTAALSFMDGGALSPGLFTAVRDAVNTALDSVQTMLRNNGMSQNIVENAKSGLEAEKDSCDVFVSEVNSVPPEEIQAEYAENMSEQAKSVQVLAQILQFGMLQQQTLLQLMQRSLAAVGG